jgi:uncharacterized protein DUF2510
MTRTARPAGWHGDPYRRHEQRFWDGRAWTPRVLDLGVPADDPVFPVPDGDASRYLAPSSRWRSPSGLAAIWGAGGFLAVLILAVASPAVGPADSAPGRPAASGSPQAIGAQPYPGLVVGAGASPRTPAPRRTDRP